MTPITPAHQAFREKRAENYAIGLDRPKVVSVDFLAGANAEHEVARLMGRIEACRDMEEKFVIEADLAADPLFDDIDSAMEWMRAKTLALRLNAEAGLAALLAKGEA